MKNPLKAVSDILAGTCRPVRVVYVQCGEKETDSQEYFTQKKCPLKMKVG